MDFFEIDVLALASLHIPTEHARAARCRVAARPNLKFGLRECRPNQLVQRKPPVSTAGCLLR